MVVTTIHQAKGLEWPVVVVGSLDGAGGGDRDGPGAGRLRSWLRPLSPSIVMDEFDRMRQHYVAFSRPQGLLVLTAGKPPASRFASIWDGLPCWSSMDAPALDRLFRQRFAPEGPITCGRRNRHPPRETAGAAALAEILQRKTTPVEPPDMGPSLPVLANLSPMALRPEQRRSMNLPPSVARLAGFPGWCRRLS